MGASDIAEGTTTQAASTIGTTQAASTIGTWPEPVVSDEAKGTIDYAVSNPVTFILENENNHDWYYTGSRMRITMIGIIQAVKKQTIPVGSPPRPSTTLVLLATEFLMVVIMVYGPKLSGKIQVLKMKEDLTAQIRVSTSVHPEKALLSFPTAQVPAGILLPVGWSPMVLCKL